MLADFVLARPRRLFCEKYLTLPFLIINSNVSVPFVAKTRWMIVLRLSQTIIHDILMLKFTSSLRIVACQSTEKILMLSYISRHT